MFVMVLASVSLSAQRIEPPKPKVHKDKTLWELVVFEQHGAKVHVECLRRTKDEAVACGKLLTFTSSDWEIVPIPRTLPAKGGAQ
jgi:hypothetical protein